MTFEGKPAAKGSWMTQTLRRLGLSLTDPPPTYRPPPRAALNADQNGNGPDGYPKDNPAFREAANHQLKLGLPGYLAASQFQRRLEYPESKAMWTRHEAFHFLGLLREDLAKVGYAVALAGSILYRGTSEKDLDVVIFPLGGIEPPSPNPDLTALREALNDFGLTMRLDHEATMQTWRAIGSQDTKHVEVWDFGDRRVDLFFLR